uniref:Uncharacterized protein n=1 Tax=Arundo donax TaxID=35708 RepID=A0A0A9AKC1_ARUDO
MSSTWENYKQSFTVPSPLVIKSNQRKIRSPSLYKHVSTHMTY